MRSVETTGKTIEEAKQKAVQELNVPEQEIEF
ncbi:MAG: Jag N-terminal domain-containing protein [Armatimonadetes bacterium]|nr:Jag N-terminal domain-containing protein [Armatimonadota bacterium]